MSKMQLFWAGFGPWIVGGFLAAIFIVFLGWASPVVPGVKPFEPIHDFFPILGISTYLFGLVGIARGAIAAVEGRLTPTFEEE